eukprot:gene16807-10243_t
MFDALKIRARVRGSVDIAENNPHRAHSVHGVHKWLRKRLTDKAGKCPRFVGTFDQLSRVNDEGQLFDHLEERGYRYPYERPKQIIFSSELPEGDEGEEES